MRVHPALSHDAADPRKQGEQLAGEALRRVKRSGRRVLGSDLAPIAEDVFGVDIAVVETEEWFDGVAWCEEEAKVAVLGSSPWPGRQRFALAHLMCHLLVEDEYGLHVDASIDHLPAERERSELRANAFAETLLMPETALQSAVPEGGWTDCNFAAVTFWLRVPARAVAARLNKLGLMSIQEQERFEGLRGPEVARLSNATELYADRRRRAAQPRLPARLVRDALMARAGA